MKEYYQFNPALYDFVSTGIDGDIDFYAEEAMKAGSPVLELGCGTGRILIPIAQEGIEITGLDQSPDMLSRAKEKTAKLDDETRNRIELVQGDMRSFSFKKKFNLIIIPYRAFLHLLTSEDQMMALTCIRNHLKDDGKLILNFFDPNLEMIAAHSGYLGAACKKMQECIHPDNGNRIIVWDNLKYHPASQLIDINFIFEELDKTGRVISKHYIFMNMRYIFRYEMQHLLELCGFKIEALYGDCRRGDFRYAGEQGMGGKEGELDVRSEKAEDGKQREEVGRQKGEDGDCSHLQPEDTKEPLYWAENSGWKAVVLSLSKDLFPLFR